MGTPKADDQLREESRDSANQLAKLGVSEQVRAQLLSHGRGGVQARHYNKHNYLAEKTEALALWQARIAKTDQGQGASAREERADSMTTLEQLKFPKPLRIERPLPVTLLGSTPAQHAEHDRQVKAMEDAIRQAVLKRMSLIVERYGDRYGEEGLGAALEVSMELAPAYHLIGGDRKRRGAPSSWGVMRYFYLWRDVQAIKEREDCSEREAVKKLALENREEYLGATRQSSSVIAKPGRTIRRPMRTKHTSESEDELWRSAADSLWRQFSRSKKSPMVQMFMRVVERIGRERARYCLEELVAPKARTELLEYEATLGPADYTSTGHRAGS